MLKQILQPALILLLLFSTSLTAESALLQDWAGLRTSLEERGVTAEAILTTDLLHNTRGGNERDGTILGNFDLTFEVDSTKAS